MQQIHLVYRGISACLENTYATVNNTHHHLDITVKHDSTFFVLDFGFDILDSVAGLHLEGDGFTRQCFHKNLHCCLLKKEARRGVSIYKHKSH